ncbi:GNAT family N-acetyltransferase [Nocardia salmonicida]|uniref:GNAT family N-acetyltransferase n=1 Tax=Nocardia salmonicida TaxID=53431 RepID=UPI001041F86E|nr:GNAT family N-acetyltransferase [Nocardia salmonicida]
MYAADGYPVEGIAMAEGWLSPPGELAAWTAIADGAAVAHVSVGVADPSDAISRVWSQTTGQDADCLIVPARLFVDPLARSLGIGGRLMSEVARYAARTGRPIAFDVMLKDRAAIRLYERAGCIRIGEFDYTHSDGQTERAAVYAVPGP